MANTFFGMTIASSGLAASNISINTTAHNISNVNTEGYTKQYANTSPSSSIRVYSTYGTVGTGVTVNSIDQLRSSYYDTKYWNNNANYGEYSTLERYSLLAEDYLDEFTLEGFITEYENFFKTVNSLTMDPTSDVARNQFVNYALSLCNYFNTLSTNLADVQKSANDEVKTTVDSINTIAEQIASLNKQINVIEINGGVANDLRDSRNLLVDELSKYINTSVTEKDMGGGATEYIVYINDQILVDGYYYNTILCEARGSVNFNDLAEEIIEYNRQINDTESTGGDATDLRASRDKLINELDKYFDVQVNETPNGDGTSEYTVFVNNEKFIETYDYKAIADVTGESSVRRNASDTNGLYQLRWNNGLTFNVYNSAMHGSLKAAIDIRDGCNSGYEILGMVNEDGEFFKKDGEVVSVYDLTGEEYVDLVAQGYTKELTLVVDPYRNSTYKGIPYYQQQINEFCSTFSKMINSTIKGDNANEIDFFVNNFSRTDEVSNYITAANVTVNPDIIKDISLLPYSYDPTQGAANVDMVTALYELREEVVLDNCTFEEYLRSIVSVIGIDAKRSTTFSENYDNIRSTIDNQRLSISGVDEDEEAVDLVKFQNAYQLSSKVISVMQQIYSKLIEETGI